MRDETGKIVSVPLLHSREQITEEGDFCIGDTGGAPVACLGHLMRLASVGSSLLHGGTDGEDRDLLSAMVAFEDNVDRAHIDSIRRQFSAAWRALEIVKGDGDAKDAKASSIDAFSPEWMADIISCAASSVPGASPRWLMWECPLCLLFHLVAAAHRRNGGITERPVDENEIAKALKEANNGD